MCAGQLNGADTNADRSRTPRHGDDLAPQRSRSQVRSVVLPGSGPTPRPAESAKMSWRGRRHVCGPCAHALGVRQRSRAPPVCELAFDLPQDAHAVGGHPPNADSCTPPLIRLQKQPIWQPNRPHHQAPVKRDISTQPEQHLTMKLTNGDLLRARCLRDRLTCLPRSPTEAHCRWMACRPRSAPARPAPASWRTIALSGGRRNGRRPRLAARPSGASRDGVAVGPSARLPVLRLTDEGCGGPRRC